MDGPKLYRELAEWWPLLSAPDNVYLVDYACLLRERDGSLRVEHDRHIEGLLARADWLRWLADAGFRPGVVPFEHSDLPSGEYEVFVATRP